MKKKRIYCALGYRCNNNCLVCAVDSLTKQDKNVSSKELFIFLERFSGRKDIDFEFSGGEPTLREDLIDIFERVRRNNSKSSCILLSNGRKFSDINFTSQFSKNIPESIIIAIHGDSPKLHDMQTQVTGSFNETIQGIKNLFEFGFNVDLKIIVTKINYLRLPEIVRFIAHTFPELKHMSINGLDMQGAAEINKDLVFVSMSKQKQYIQKAIDAALEFNIVIRTYSFPFCIFDEPYRKFVGIQPPDVVTCKSPFIEKENLLANFGPIKSCNSCNYVSICGGTWHSYYESYGVKELHPIIDEVIE